MGLCSKPLTLVVDCAGTEFSCFRQHCLGIHFQRLAMGPIAPKKA